MGNFHPILIHLEPATLDALGGRHSLPAQFDARIPITASVIGDSMASRFMTAGHPDVSVGRRKGNVVVAVGGARPYFGQAFEFTVTQTGPMGFSGTWRRTRGGRQNYALDSRAFDTGPFCATRLNPALDDDEPAVYRASLDSVFSGYQGELPITLLPHLLVDTDTSALATVALMDKATLRSFLSRRRASSSLLDPIGLSRPTVILTDSARNALTRAGARLVDSALTWRPMQEAGPFWLALRREYPTPGVTQVSRVGFNGLHTEALVEVRHLCGTNCYSEEYITLTREKSSWRVSSRTVVPSQSKEGDHLSPFDYRAANRRPDNPREAFGRSPDANLPRRVTVQVTDRSTVRPLVAYEVRPESPLVEFHPRIPTDSSGRVALRNPPFGQLYLNLSCPRFADRRGRSLNVEGHLAEAFVHPGIDTTIRITVDARACNGSPLLPRFDTMRASRGLNLARGYPSGEAANVYRAAFKTILEGESDSTLLLLSEMTKHACSHVKNCGSLQLFRLQRKGIVDPTTVADFAKSAALKEQVDPRFWNARRAAVMTREQFAKLKALADSFAEGNSWSGDTANVWREVAQAFPNAIAIYTPTRVGFNGVGDEALVEVAQSTFARDKTPELLLLKKTGNEWHVTRRHIERETTSGRVVNGRCEPDAPPATTPPFDSVKNLRGSFKLQVVSTHPDDAGTTDTSTLSLWGGSYKVDARYPALNGLEYSLSKGMSRNADAANAIRISKSGEFPELETGSKWMCFDCGGSSYFVRSASERVLTGQWHPIYGIGVPINKLGEMKYEGGFFCATRLSSEPLERLHAQPAKKAVKPNVPSIAFAFQLLDSGNNAVIVNVHDTTGAPLYAAVVTLSADSATSKTVQRARTTTESGSVAFSAVIPQKYDMRVRRIGYMPVTASVATTSRTTVVSVTLRVDAPICEFCVIVEPAKTPSSKTTLPRHK
ncbi:MAG: carboxypeptidase regulatory-like domain-containing protein [Gemmatimonadaceae bacterium]|nr:carboxypeptidase regulatory-like domain-containing protein [Gemmatimonadaceae bacterium]